MGLTLVGFGGRPVSGGAGVKPALVFDSDTHRFGLVQTAAADVRWTEAEINDLEERALLTRVRTSGRLDQDSVALYAHTAFIASDVREDEPEPCSLSVERLVLEPTCESYVAFLSLGEAYALLDAWGEDLLDAARDNLLDRSYRLDARARSALRDANRARFCSAARNEPDARAMRTEAFVLAWAARLVQEVAIDALARDAALDFDEAEVAGIRERGVELAADTKRRSQSRSAKAYLDTRAAPHRVDVGP